MGCKQSKYDAVYLYYNNEGVLDGFALTHVDDLMHGSGGRDFQKNVMEPLKKKFKFGSEDRLEFRYVGMQVKQSNNCILVNQDHYLTSLELPSPRKEKDQELLDEEGQKEYRSLLGRIGWLGSHSRPDLVYDHIALSTKLGKATGADFAEAIRTGRKMIATPTEMKFPALGNMSNWVMEVYGDAGFRSLPDKISSCGGQAVILRDSTTNHACVLNWKGRKLRRVVNSSTAAETLASNEAVSEVIFLKSLLSEIFGADAFKIPVNLYTDSNNLKKSVHTTSMVDDPRLRTEIACLKESLEKGEVNDFVLIPGNKMLANCMTKKGASAKDLLECLRSGYLSNPME